MDHFMDQDVVENPYGRHHGAVVEVDHTVAAVRWLQERRLGVVSSVGMQTWELITAAASDLGLPIKLILQIHDELVFELPKADIESCAKWISDEMIGAIELDVPLKVDISYGPTWLSDK